MQVDDYSDASAHDCGNSSALALELPQSHAKPLIYLHYKSAKEGLI